MKYSTPESFKKLGTSVVVLVLMSVAYSHFQKQQQVEAEEIQRFVDEVNAREDQLNEELQPLIERNKELNQRSGFSAEHLP